jgi:itaconate CoA-transferase
VTAYHTILAALIGRGRTGKGDHIDISMLEAMAEWMGFPMYFAIDGQDPPPRSGAGHATIYPYGPYETADGTVFFGLQNDREWVAFAEKVLERPDLATDPRLKGNSGRAENRSMLEPVIAAVLGGLTSEAALARLEVAGIGTARVNDMAGLWNHPQLAARERWREFGSPAGPIPGLKPATGEGWAPRLDPVPALGEHTAAILEEFDIAGLAAKEDAS